MIFQETTEPCAVDSQDEPGAYSIEPELEMGTEQPKPDEAAILAALSALVDPDAIIELRALHKGKKRIEAGYFDGAHRAELAACGKKLSRLGAAVYFTLNPVSPQLLARYANRVEDWATETTTDKDIAHRRWLFIDLDPVRPSGTNATAIQLTAARLKANSVIALLHNQGWPLPAVALSGNGYHLLYAIDLPNDDSVRDLIKAFLTNLGGKFDDGQVKIDTNVFNAARICKLYGTVANKGDHLPDYPQRLSRLIHIPTRIEVTKEQIEKTLSRLPTKTTVKAGARMNPVSVVSVGSTTKEFQKGKPLAFGLEEFLKRHGLQYSKDTHDGSERYKLAQCPFNPAHGTGESAIFRRTDNGALGFKCQHDSCSDKVWRDVRELFDGPESSCNEWCEPTPLPDALPPVAPFHSDLLPEALRPWVMDIAHRMQCPPDFVAVAALVGISSLVGARLVVRPKVRDDWEVVPNLWGMVVGSPGLKKSPALKEALRPIQALQAKEHERHAELHAAWEIDCSVAALVAKAREEEAKSLAKKRTPDQTEKMRELLTPATVSEEPSSRSYILNDATVEKLGEILAKNQWGLLVYRDELYGLLTSLDKQGQEGSRSFYLTGYDGNQGYTVERIVRGTVRIERVCLALLGGIQPGRVQEYVRGAVEGGSGDDGLLQRFGLAVWPDIGAYETVDQWPDADARAKVQEVFDRTQWALPTGDCTSKKVHFSVDAQPVFNQWLFELEGELRDNTMHPAMVAHLAKYRKLIPALALLFAFVDDVHEMTDDHDDLVIDLVDLERALLWDRYLRTHAVRLYAAASRPDTTNAKTLLQKIRAGKLCDASGAIVTHFAAREVAQKGWTGLGKVEDVHKACSVLIDYGWLQSTITKSHDDLGRGRPAERFHINPLAIAH